MEEGMKIEQRYGKSRVRVCRVWRRQDAGIRSAGDDVMVEWDVSISLVDSDCLPAYTSGDNSAIVATDSMKNTVYAKAKECTEVLSVEKFAILLANHFTSFYPQVTEAVISIVEKPWERVFIEGIPHSHGFKLGKETRTTEVTMKKNGTLTVKSGLKGFSLLKTTQSGFEGFVRDPYTLITDTSERMVATDVTADWRYNFGEKSEIPQDPFWFTKRNNEMKKVLGHTFFGSPNVGVYSPSIENTLYLMAQAVLNRFEDIASVHLRLPNLHFLPVNLSSKENPSMVKFEDDVYLPTDEPHGVIEATVGRTII